MPVSPSYKYAGKRLPKGTKSAVICGILSALICGELFPFTLFVTLPRNK